MKYAYDVYVVLDLLPASASPKEGCCPFVSVSCGFLPPLKSTTKHTHTHTIDAASDMALHPPVVTKDRPAEEASRTGSARYSAVRKV